jgi:hypothetical protein
VIKKISLFDIFTKAGYSVNLIFFLYDSLCSLDLKLNHVDTYFNMIQSTWLVQIHPDESVKKIQG